MAAAKKTAGAVGAAGTPQGWAGQLRALTDLSLRQSPDPKSPLFEEWHEWKAGAVFTPPAHMNVAKALARGIVEEV